jgi:hypothetical protein
MPVVTFPCPQCCGGGGCNLCGSTVHVYLGSTTGFGPQGYPRSGPLVDQLHTATNGFYQYILDNAGTPLRVDIGVNTVSGTPCAQMSVTRFFAQFPPLTVEATYLGSPFPGFPPYSAAIPGSLWFEVNHPAFFGAGPLYYVLVPNGVCTCPVSTTCYPSFTFAVSGVSDAGCAGPGRLTCCAFYNRNVTINYLAANSCLYSEPFIGVSTTRQPCCGVGCTGPGDGAYLMTYSAALSSWLLSLQCAAEEYVWGYPGTFTGPGPFVFALLSSAGLCGNIPGTLSLTPVGAGEPC